MAIEYWSRHEGGGTSGVIQYAKYAGLTITAMPHQAFHHRRGRTTLTIGWFVRLSRNLLDERGMPKHVTAWAANLWDNPLTPLGSSMFVVGRQFEEDKDGAFQWGIDQLKLREKHEP